MPPNHDSSDSEDYDSSDSEDSSEQRDEGTTGIIDQIRSVLEELAAIEQEEGRHRRASGHIDRERSQINYTYDVTIGLGDRLPATPESAAGQSTDPPSEDQAQRQPIHVETREADNSDELVVIADLPGVTDDEFDIGLVTDPPAIELRDADGVIDRIQLNQSDVTITDVTLNNQILEVRLARGAASNRGNHP